jgi:predicted O-linked N-acetylglucosamine transferase (SPINDLY family)
MHALRPVYESLHRRDWEVARARCRELLTQIPDLAPAHHALGLAYCGEGSFPLATPHLERAVSIDGTSQRFVSDLAAVYAQSHRWRETAQLLRSSAAAADDDAFHLYVVACVECGDADLALDGIRQRYGETLPDSAPLLAEYGRVLYLQGHYQSAEILLQRALSHDGRSLRALDGLAMVSQETGRTDEALQLWSECVRAQPDSGRAHLRLAMALAQKGRLTESARERTEAVRLGLAPPDYSRALYMMLFDEDQTAAGLRDAYRAAFPAPSVVRSRVRRPRGGRPRIAYLSGEFTLTPAYYFISPFLANHDRSRIELFLYNTNGRQVVRRPAYVQPGDTWRDVSSSSDEQLLSVVAEDGIDVLVDLSGHFPDNRLSVFARRAAGVQACFPNFPSTTGCPEVDYLFTDEWASPPGSEVEYVEALYRLPSGYLAYLPPDDAPEIGELPALRNGCTTFGVVQRSSKLTPTMWDCYAGILRRAPGSRLLIHNGEVELDEEDSGMAVFLRRQLSARGVDPGRLLLRGRRELRAHLALLNEVDIVLDTWPYGGQTTTAECLWMGVPVVTLAGPTNVSRVSASLVARAGLTPLIARSPEAFVEVAVAAGADVDALAALRRVLRGRARETITNGSRLATEIEDAYLSWCSS